MTEQKRPRGRPMGTKKNRANAEDAQSIINKIEQERNVFDAKVANNLSKYYEILDNIALAQGDFKDAGIKDRKTAAETLVKRAEKYAESQKPTAQKTVEELEELAEDIYEAPSISLKAVN